MTVDPATRRARAEGGATWGDFNTATGEHGLATTGGIISTSGLQHSWKANFVRELSDDMIAAHLEHGPRVPVVNSAVHIYPVNGACQRVAPDATAFAYRDANFAPVIAGTWPDPADNEANIRWVKDYYTATAPVSEEGGYINFMAGDDRSRQQASPPHLHRREERNHAKRPHRG